MWPKGLLFIIRSTSFTQAYDDVGPGTRIQVCRQVKYSFSPIFCNFSHRMPLTIVFAAFLWITYVLIITNKFNSHILFYSNIHVYAGILEFYGTSLMSLGSMWDRCHFVLPDSQLRDRSRRCVRHPGPAGRRWRHRGIRSPENRHDHFLCRLWIPVLAGVNCFMFNNVPHRSLSHYTSVLQLKSVTPSTRWRTPIPPSIHTLMGKPAMVVVDDR